MLDLADRKPPSPAEYLVATWGSLARNLALAGAVGLAYAAVQSILPEPPAPPAEMAGWVASAPVWAGPLLLVTLSLVLLGATAFARTVDPWVGAPLRAVLVRQRLLRVAAALLPLLPARLPADEVPGTLIEIDYPWHRLEATRRALVLAAWIVGAEAFWRLAVFLAGTPGAFWVLPGWGALGATLWWIGKGTALVAGDGGPLLTGVAVWYLVFTNDMLRSGTCWTDAGVGPGLVLAELALLGMLLQAGTRQDGRALLVTSHGLRTVESRRGAITALGPCRVLVRLDARRRPWLLGFDDGELQVAAPTGCSPEQLLNRMVIAGIQLPELIGPGRGDAPPRAHDGFAVRRLLVCVGLLAVASRVIEAMGRDGRVGFARTLDRIHRLAESPDPSQLWAALDGLDRYRAPKAGRSWLETLAPGSTHVRIDRLRRLALARLGDPDQAPAGWEAKDPSILFHYRRGIVRALGLDDPCTLDFEFPGPHLCFPPDIVPLGGRSPIPDDEVAYRFMRALLIVFASPRGLPTWQDRDQAGDPAALAGTLSAWIASREAAGEYGPAFAVLEADPRWTDLAQDLRSAFPRRLGRFLLAAETARRLRGLPAPDGWAPLLERASRLSYFADLPFPWQPSSRFRSVRLAPDLRLLDSPPVSPAALMTFFPKLARCFRTPNQPAPPDSVLPLLDGEPALARAWALWPDAAPLLPQEVRAAAAAKGWLPPGVR